MVRPFSIEEIFSDLESTRLVPRRQAAGSSLGLAVTLIADYTWTTRAWLPSAAIVALLGEFGVTSGASRTTISRLARRGVLEGSRRGRHSWYRLTESAATGLGYGSAIADFAARTDAWDGSWTVVSFSLPDQESSQRRALRRHLRWNGYALLYDGVWVWPHPLTADARAELARVALGSITVFRAQHLELVADANRSPVEAWDLPAIAARYEEFIGRWGGLLPRIAAGAVTGADAVRARTEVMDVYRRFPVLDPMLPVELMPADWPRARAREAFVAVYDGLAGAAERHIRAVVERAADESYGGIRAHTVAEMSVD